MKQVKVAVRPRSRARVPADKLATPDLRARAASLDPAPVDVLVEVDVPRVTIECGPALENAARPRHMRLLKPAKQSHAARTVKSARSMLEKLSSSEPVWLAAAGAFVVSLNGEQLLAAAASPYTKKIWANRLLRRRPRAATA